MTEKIEWPPHSRGSTRREHLAGDLGGVLHRFALLSAREPFLRFGGWFGSNVMRSHGQSSLW